MFLNFSDIAGHQNLFLDYMYEFENVKQFYNNNFRDFDNYNQHFLNIKKGTRANRNKLVEIINQQYKQFKPSKLTEQNITALKNDNTIAIITGQQLGILGGPLYTLYKTMTAIKLCAELKNKYENFNFVPVFWLEGDDHDFDEISQLNFIDKNNSLRMLKYNDGLEEESNRGSIGNLIFNENIEILIEELKESLRHTDFTNEVFDLIEPNYYKGKSIKSAFSGLIFDLFDEYGLIIFDPQNKPVKELLKPIFKSEIENYKTNSAISIARSAELENLYHAQVKIKPINLFVSDDTGRHSLEPGENYFRLKNKRKKFSKDELLELLNQYPELFSPNVMLRPICQDYLFPTGLYIGGPGEINYFAQVSTLYKCFNIEPPIIYPRASLTIIEKNIFSTLNKLNLKYQDFFLGKDFFNDKVLNLISEINLDQIFNDTENQVKLLFSSLSDEIIHIDQHLNSAVNKIIEKTNQNLKNIKNKAIKAQQTKHSVTLRQIQKIETLIFPNEKLQERVLSFIYFVNKYGVGILKWMINEISINKFEHQILEL